MLCRLAPLGETWTCPMVRGWRGQLLGVVSPSFHAAACRLQGSLLMYWVQWTTVGVLSITPGSTAHCLLKYYLQPLLDSVFPLGCLHELLTFLASSTLTPTLTPRATPHPCVQTPRVQSRCRSSWVRCLTSRRRTSPSTASLCACWAWVGPSRTTGRTTAASHESGVLTTTTSPLTVSWQKHFIYMRT